MSFSTDLKTEQRSHMPKSIHCRLALLAGFVSINGRLEEVDGKTALAIRVDSDDTEEYIAKLVSMCSGIPRDHLIAQNEKNHHRKLLVVDTEEKDRIFAKLKLRADDTRVKVAKVITERECCKRSYLKGAFMAGGSVGSPEKAYQMEIASLSEDEAERLSDILSLRELKSSIVIHRDRYIVYIKDGDTISEVLGLMGASCSLMEFENIRILKGIRNDVNREVNCDAANMAKIAKSSKKQLEDIEYIRDTAGLDSLPEALEEMARVRLEYPYYSLKELGYEFNPPLGKSGVSHRLRRLSEVADKLRG